MIIKISNVRYVFESRSFIQVEILLEFILHMCIIWLEYLMYMINRIILHLKARIQSLRLSRVILTLICLCNSTSILTRSEFKIVDFKAILCIQIKWNFPPPYTLTTLYNMSTTDTHSTCQNWTPFHVDENQIFVIWWFTSSTWHAHGRVP